jgi:zinc protease
MKRRNGSPSATKAGAAIKAGARITEHRLENGLTVLLAERHLDPVVAVMLWYRVGSRNEEEREAGVSHFLEHMMFKGSRRFGKGEIDRITTALGGGNNAFTTSDHTAYWFEFASDRWEKALEIEADRMRNLLLDPREFDSEKAVVLEELSMGEDEPWRALSQEVQLALFQRHPYRRPVIGFADSLGAMTVDDMRAYYARHYRPSNAVLVLAGDFEPRRALEVVRTRFGSFRVDREAAEGAGRPAFRPGVPGPRGERRVTILWADEGRRLCVAWPTTPVGTDDDWALDLLSTILAGGKLSRLHRRLVIERHLATSVSSHNDTRVDTGAFWLFVECARGIDPEALELALWKEIAALSDVLVQSKELDRAKRMLASSEAHENETVTDIAEQLGEFAVDADWRLALEAPAKIAAVTAQAIRNCARTYLSEGRRVVGWCLPKARGAR